MTPMTPMTLKEVRTQFEKNKEITTAYYKMLDDAEIYLENNLIELDRKQQIQVSICDHYRERYPNDVKTDEEILERYKELEEKYAKEEIEFEESK